MQRYESEIIAQDAELKINYAAELEKIKLKIQDLSIEDRTNVINDHIRRWTSPFWQLLDDDDFIHEEDIKKETKDSDKKETKDSDKKETKDSDKKETKDSDEERFSPIPRGTNIRAVMKARNANPQFIQFIEKLTNLLWESTDNKIRWMDNQTILYDLIKALRDVGAVVFKGEIEQYAYDHFVDKDGNPLNKSSVKQSGKRILQNEAKKREDTILDTVKK